MQASLIVQQIVPRNHSGNEAKSAIKWKLSNRGWHKLNCDATVCHMGRKAAAGGVLRSEGGDFIFAFSFALGGCNTLEA